MKKGLILLLLAVCFVATSVSSQTNDAVPLHLLESSFPGRSGRIIVGTVETPELNSRSSMFLRTEKRYKSEEIEDKNVGNLISHVLGVNPPLNEGPIDRSGFPAAELFGSPSCNVLFVIKDVAADELYQVPFEKLAFTKDQEVIVHPSYLAQGSLSYVETVLSASSPAVHGIVRESWLDQAGNEVRAFAHGQRSLLPHATSLFDTLSMSEPTSLLFSLSADPQLSSALSTLPNFASENVRQFSYDSFLSKFIDWTTGDSMKVDMKPLERLLEESGVSLREGAAAEVAVALKDEAEVVVPAAEALFAELQGLSLLVERLQQEELLLGDQFPDALSIGISGLAEVKAAAGVDSAAFAVALQLTDLAMSAATERLSALANNGEVVREILFMAAPRLPLRLQEARRAVEEDEWLRGICALPVRQTFPEIYLSPHFTDKQLHSIAEQVSELLRSPVQAFVLPADNLRRSTRSLALTRDSNSTDSDDDEYAFTNEDVANFQFVLWTTVILFFAILASACAMYSLHWEGEGDGLYMQTTFVGKDHIKIH